MKTTKKEIDAIVPFALLFIAIFLRHINLDTDYSDDAWFRNIFMNQAFSVGAMIDFLYTRYQTWSSRVLIDGIAVVITHFPLAWKVLDTIVLLLIALLIPFVFGMQNHKSTAWSVCAGMILYPFSLFGTAGWIVTTVNYSWPFLAGLIGMIPFSLVWQGKKLSWKMGILSCPFLLFGCNNEQLCLFLMGVSIICLIVFYRTGRSVPALILIEELIIVLSLVFVFTCPGNRNRMILEIERWFPEYATLSPFTRFEMGYSSTGYLLVLSRNILFFLFCCFLFFNVWMDYRGSIPTVIAAIPVISCLITGMLPEVFCRIFPHLVNLRNQMGEKGTGCDLRNPLSCIPDLYLLIVFICILYSLMIVYKEIETRMFVIGLLLAGLGTRVMIGFSPTIWASSERTACFLYFTLIMLVVLLIFRLNYKHNCIEVK